MVDESKFDELCRLIGLAILMSQKLQFALAHYHAFHKIAHNGASKAEAKQSIAKSLSKTLGVVITQVKSEAPLDVVLTERLDSFLKERNWLAHDFDIEATPVIAAEEDFSHFAERMAGISSNAHALMVDLDKIGDAMAREGANPSLKRTAPGKPGSAA